jgi:hypothetical protein
LYFSFKGINFKKFSEAFVHANYYWIGLSLILSWLALVIRAYRWNLLLEPLNYKSDTINNYHAVVVGYLANIAFPRLGEITRCATLSKVKKIPVDKLIGTVLTERIFDLLMLFIITGTIIFIKYDFFGGFLNETIFQPLFSNLSKTFDFSTIFWIFLFVFGILTALVIYFYKENLKKVILVRKIWNLGKGVLEGIVSVIRMNKKGQFIICTILIWLMYYLMGYIVFFSLPATSQLTMIDGLFILVIASLGMTAPVQGGFGVFHAIVSLGLTLYGISREEGLVYAVLVHESQMILIIVLGSLSFLLLFLASNKKLKNI